MVQLEPDGRLTVGNDLVVEFVHGHQCTGVRVDGNETVAGGLAGELVFDNADVDHVVFAQRLEGFVQECVCHVEVQAPHPQHPFFQLWNFLKSLKVLITTAGTCLRSAPFMLISSTTVGVTELISVNRLVHCSVVSLV